MCLEVYGNSLGKMECMTNEAPKEYLESILTKELEAILGNLDSSIST